jgi:hypothetical protein
MIHFKEETMRELEESRLEIKEQEERHLNEIDRLK